MTPETMRAAVLYDVNDVRIEERAVPELRDGELLVRTMASGICSGDVMGWYIARKAPLVLGHEPAGIVAAVAGDCALSVGDRVFVHHHAPCFECRACKRGDYVQCATWRATRIEPGGIAEYFRVSRENQRDTLPLPASVPFRDASLVEPLACF
jgi:L-iditol 2-dehydrogenase